METPNFDTFDEDDWTSFARGTLDYPENDYTLDDLMAGDAEDKELELGRTNHLQDDRLQTKKQRKELDMDNPADFLTELYLLKDFIEVSPHPENTNVRVLGALLRKVYEEFGIEPTGFRSGELIDEFERKYEDAF